jgi:hypothetical protein
LKLTDSAQQDQLIRECQRRHSQASKAPGAISLDFLAGNMMVRVKRQADVPQ